MNTNVIYTAIIGNYDVLKAPNIITPGWDYICFTNNPKLKSDKWTIKFLEEDHGLDNTRLARRVKILPHKYIAEYDLSIWVDGNMNIATDLDSFVEQALPKDKDLSLMTHGSRGCIYDEALECIKQKKDADNTITAQIVAYRNEGFPENQGMVQTGIEIRKHNSEDLIKFNEAWFEEVRTRSKRDQLSFNYVCWKLGIPKYIMFSHSVLFNPKFFQIKQHNHGW
jgi:hypothetical protein